MSRIYPSPYAEMVVDYVKQHPGCCKADVARYVTYRRHFGQSYPIVNTAIKYGAIVAVRKNGRYSLRVA